MALTVSTSWSSGSWDKHSAACVGVAGTGLPSAYYYTHGNLNIRQNDDGSIDIQQTSLSVEQNNISDANTDGGWGSDTWTFHGLYINKTAFTLYDGPSGPSGYGAGVQVWSSGHISHQGYGSESSDPTSHYSWLSSGSSSGWKRIANSVEELDHNSAQTEIYLYAGGIIDYASSPTSSISIPSQRIVLRASGEPGIPELFKYYPWQRRINNIWYSLNRSGGSQRVIGLFRRLNNEYQPCTNKVGSTITADDHGFRYNNGWQKSPKSGEGAV